MHGRLQRRHAGGLAKTPLHDSAAGHANATDHGADAIAVGHRPRQRLDDQGDIALGRHQAVGLAPKRTRTAVAHGLGCGEEHEAVRLAVGSAADDRLIDSPLQNGAGANRHCLQRRRAGRVHHQIRTVEAEGLLHDPGSSQRRKIGLFPRLSAGIVLADGSGNLRRYPLHIVSQRRAGSLHFPQQSGRLLDAGGVDLIANPGAAAGVPHVDACPAVCRHGKGIHSRIAAGL